MAVYLGQTHLTGTTEICIGTGNSTVYIGKDLTYPENVRYVFENGAVHYSSGNVLNAAGSNSAYYAADVKLYVGSDLVATYLNVKMNALRVSGDTHIQTTWNAMDITADSRTNVTGNSRSTVFNARYRTGDETITVGQFTVTQEANVETWHNITTSVDNPMVVACGTGARVYNGIISYYGANYCLIGQRYWKDWYTYTSGYNSGGTSYTTGQTTVTASSYTNLGTWLHTTYTDTKLFTSDTNTNMTNRTKTITAKFSGGTDTSYTNVSFTVEQYRNTYDDYGYRINTWSIDQTEWEYDQSGITYYATFTADCEYRTAHWEDGSTYYGPWTDYNSHHTVPSPVYNARPILICGQGHWGFYTYPSGTTSNIVDLYYENSSSQYGKMRVYPVSGNPISSDLTNTLTVNFGTASSQTTLTQKGDGTFTISPTSLNFGYAANYATITVTTSLSNWSVNDSADWITTSVNGNVVTVSVTENTSTSNERTATVNFTQGGSLKNQCVVTQAMAPAPAIANVETLYEMSNGWIVGRYYTGRMPDPYNSKIYTLVIARSNRGTDCTFNFASDGYYNLHTGPSTTVQHWTFSSKSYTGQSINTTDADGNPVQFYGFSIGGGPGAETSSYYSGISIA